VEELQRTETMQGLVEVMEQYKRILFIHLILLLLQELFQLTKHSVEVERLLHLQEQHPQEVLEAIPTIGLVVQVVRVRCLPMGKQQLVWVGQTEERMRPVSLKRER